MDLAGDGGLIDCEEGEEIKMDSESSRRMLYRRLGKYVSYYSIIEMDSVPCDRRGHSYYSCMYRGPVRPYMRGCSRFTKCRDPLPHKRWRDQQKQLAEVCITGGWDHVVTCGVTWA
nr:protein RALF-like 33 [Ipomoea batatas]